MKACIKIGLLLLLLLLLGLVWYTGLFHYFQFAALKTHQQALEKFVAENWVIAVLLFGLTYVALVILSIPATAFMSLTGGFLFGQWVGIVTVVFSATLGASLLFLSVRFASSGWLTKKKNGLAIKIQHGFQAHAFLYLLSLRLIPIFPFPLVNVAAAIFQIPFKTFLFGTLLGILPSSFIFVAAGLAMHELFLLPNFSPSTVLEPKILFALLGLGLLALLPLLFHWKKPKFFY